MILFLKILGGLIALGYGIYLGMGGQYRADPQELEEALGPGGRTRKVKRHFTPLGWLRKTDERGSRTRRMQRGGRRRFEMVVPKPREVPSTPPAAADQTPSALQKSHAEDNGARAEQGGSRKATSKPASHPGAPKPKEVAPDMKEVLPDHLKKK